MIFSRISLLKPISTRFAFPKFGLLWILCLLWILNLLVAMPVYAAENSVQTEAKNESPTENKVKTEITPNFDQSDNCAPVVTDSKDIPPQRIDNKIHLQSDSADLSKKGVTTFHGNVTIQQNNTLLTADKALYKKNEQDIDARGNVKLTKGSLKLSGDSLKMNLKTNLGDIQNAKYHDSSSKAQGKAENITIKSKTELQMNDATYTTCNDPSPAWELSASNINLNNETHQGSASNVVVRFQNIPFLYLPYLRFPIGDERLSGFLFPSFGSSDANGNELYVPYYWNIHPQIDATITPHFMEKRGTQLQSEFRYLTEETNGQFFIDYLPNDSTTQTDRQLFSWQHNQAPRDGWSGGLDINYVSDEFYFDDFGGDLETASQTNIERRADIRYDSENWIFTGRAQGYQTLIENEQTKRLPQLNFNTRQTIKPNEINTAFQSELTRFSHSTKEPIGDRLVLQPSISLPLSSAAAYTTFLTSLHYTQYSLDRIEADEKDNPTRSVPIVSIDSGLFFERDSSFNSNPFLHTLEPRLQYLYIPYREQSTLPIFDTATISSDINQLFSSNRFSGADRINDANQITYGLTSRYISLDSGAEVLTATLGQTYQFEDSRVTLEGTPVRKESWSDLQLDVTYQPISSLKINGTLIRNQETREIDQKNIRMQYRTDSQHIFNINYRFQRDTLETREISGIWQVHPQWVLLARKHEDLRQDRELESVYGVQYDSCCWGLRFVKRRYYTDAYPTEPYQDAFFIEFELKGLSSFGQKKQIDSLLNRGILGYSN